MVTVNVPPCAPPEKKISAVVKPLIPSRASPVQLFVSPDLTDTSGPCYPSPSSATALYMKPSLAPEWLVTVTRTYFAFMGS